MDTAAFSEFIRMARRLGGLTQARVAREAGIAQPHLNAIEKAERIASPAMRRRILASIFNLALAMRLSERGLDSVTASEGTRRTVAMTSERFAMLRSLSEMTEDEAEEFILSESAKHTKLKRDIAYKIWKSELEEKRERLG